MSPEPNAQAHATADAVARRSYGKLVAFLTARTHDVAAAEDALSEAFAAALTDWPRNGCPTNPEAGLLTVARRKAIDTARSRRHEETTAVLADPFLAELAPYVAQLDALQRSIFLNQVRDMAMGRRKMA